MLGPVRFQHIENCARAALSQYLINEAMITLKQQLRDLDDQLVPLRSQLPGSSTIVKANYDDLNLEKAERLIIARKKAIEMLKKRVDAMKFDVVTAPLPSAPEMELITDTTAVSAPQEKAEKVPTVPEVVAEEIADDDLTGWDALE